MKILFSIIALFLLLSSCKKSANLPDAPSNKEAYEFVNSFQCIDGNCEETERGPYSTISECESYCGENQDVFVDPRDGNEYRIITYEGKTWFKENLRFTQNIDYVNDLNAWYSKTTPAYTFYDNSDENKTLYGIMYNGYAVLDMDLCPNGWHVPTDDDYVQNILQPGLVISDVMATAGWDLPRSISTNSTGYTGLPGGELNSMGFQELGISGNWWTSTEGSNGLRYIRVANQGFSLGFLQSPKENGYYCRCVKDE